MQGLERFAMFAKERYSKIPQPWRESIICIQILISKDFSLIQEKPSEGHNRCKDQ